MVTMTVVIAPTIVIITPAMALMMALMPRPIAETTDPIVFIEFGWKSAVRLLGWLMEETVCKVCPVRKFALL